jgi:hypothetical protein
MSSTQDLARTREAASLRAQAHSTGCRCVLCQAAAGDEQALRDVHTFIEQWREPPEHRDFWPR